MAIFQDKQFSPLASKVSFTDDMMTVYLVDGRILSVPVDYFPKLSSADSADRNNWRLIGGGVGIRWENLDEDISVKGLLQ